MTTPSSDWRFERLRYTGITPFLQFTCISDEQAQIVACQIKPDTILADALLRLGAERQEEFAALAATQFEISCWDNIVHLEYNPGYWYRERLVLSEWRYESSECSYAARFNEAVNVALDSSAKAYVRRDARVMACNTIRDLHELMAAHRRTDNNGQ